MGLSAEFSLLHSELNDFLFAQMGEEASGVPITILSALTRLGIDPWAEGARLSDLPKDAAAQSLAAMIARFSRQPDGASEVVVLAERLAGLLPHRVDHVTGIRTGNRQPAGWRAARIRLERIALERQWRARLSKPVWFVVGLGVAALLFWLIGSFG